MGHRKLSKLMKGGVYGGFTKKTRLASNYLPQGSKVLLTLVLSWFHGVCYRISQKCWGK